MTIAGLHVVSDRRLVTELGLTQALAEASKAGAAAVHLRELDMPAGELLSLAGRIRAVLQPETLLLINDRLDVALLAGADGVQLGEMGLPPDVSRRIVPSKFIIGRSVHSLAAAIEAVRDGADFLLVGTIFPSRSHPGGATAGVNLIRTIRVQTDKPIIAIGGINDGNARSVMDAGANGVAVISSVLGAPNVYSAAHALVSLVKNAQVDSKE